ncbi:MAG TPA: glycerol-3-phosphate dehydrogenase/oxidase [Acidimicrobiales bacterium]|nr:glycerol-3-phosphate dehydrogenase/oxidase [Acidimicrobiales bacterium]
MSEVGFHRARALERLSSEPFDVLVIGGGATGAGVALDAATRGLRTALVERGDFAAGTSSKSSKLIHGGIRYLAQGDVSLVYQALMERRRLLRNAPHLVRILGFMLPIYRKGGLIPRIFARGFGLVLWFYDLTGGALVVGRHRRLTRDQAVAKMPTLKSDQVVSAYLYYDARVDDARLTLAIARTAADHGAAVANHCRVTGIRKDGAGKAVGATVDTGAGSIDISARVVVNAAGVWVDDVGRIDTGPGHEMMRPARGVHMVVPSQLVRNEVAVILPVQGGPGSVFAIPWHEGDLTYIGTTDTDYPGHLDHMVVDAGDIDILLSHINPNMQAPLASTDVVGTWAGVRPLLKGAKTDKTADLSRHHKITRWPSDVVSITGGKLTTYRRMAQDTVDTVLEVLDRKARCRTKAVALHGAAGHDKVDDGGLGAGVRDRLVNRYGADARLIIDRVVADRSLGEPLVAGLPYLRAEALYAAEHEMVVTLDDLLSRRTRARLLARDASAEAAESAAALVAGAMGWSPEEQRRQVERYQASVAVERAALETPAAHVAGGDRRVLPGWMPGVSKGG